MRDAVLLRIAQLPRADEEIEAEVVNPPGQQQLALLEQRRHVGQRSESSLGALQVRGDEVEIDGGEDEGKEKTRDVNGERRSCCSPVPFMYPSRWRTGPHPSSGTPAPLIPVMV